MWSRKKKTEDIDKGKRITELEAELASTNATLARAKEKLEEYAAAARKASFHFDFKAVKAFSVERNSNKEGIPVTIIGYLLPEPVVFSEGETSTKDVVREWYLYCDEKQHEQIVKDFKESRNV